MDEGAHEAANYVASFVSNNGSIVAAESPDFQLIV